MVETRIFSEGEDELLTSAFGGSSGASDLSSSCSDLQSMQQLIDTEDFFDMRSLSAASAQPLAKKSSVIQHDVEVVNLTDFGFSNVLEQALKPESALKAIILKRSALIYADETFRFYAAILEWERSVKESHKAVFR
ncbi:MAG TPA: hypothetical protein VEF04_23365 [Blastocatellia bacterium]|nr:hypothetical protein [Blastocatellia bacterium]